MCKNSSVQTQFYIILKHYIWDTFDLSIYIHEHKADNMK